MVINTFACWSHTGRDDEKSRTNLRAEDRRLFARCHYPITAHLRCQKGTRGDQILDAPLNAHIVEIMGVKVGQHCHRQQFQCGRATALNSCGQRLSIGMHREEFHAHGRNPRSGTTNCFLDVEEFEVQKHSFASCNQVVNHLRSSGGEQFEPDFHEHHLILHTIKKPVGLIA